MTTRKAEPELTSSQIHELIDLAQRYRNDMSSMGGRQQALLLLDTFRVADRIYGLWPDPSRPGGYACNIMKGELGSEAMSRVAASPDISVTALFQESEEHAELTRDLYEGLVQTRNHDEAYLSAWSLWVGIVPANFAATKARIRGYLGG